MKRLRNWIMRVRGYREATISARVYRAETGKWEDRGVISAGWTRFRPETK